MAQAMESGKLRIVRPGGRGSTTLIEYGSVLAFRAFLEAENELPPPTGRSKPRKVT
jgi:hypothetical protein